MKPEQDPEICQELEWAARDIACQSERPLPKWNSSRCDKGLVPLRLRERLAGLAANYGYTVSRVDFEKEYPGEKTEGLLGATCGPAAPPELACTIRLRKYMSDSSEARVLAHEVAHVVLGHAGLTWMESAIIIEKRLRQFDLGLGKEDPGEESAAELAAGAFCQVAHVGSGLFSPAFINEKTDGRPIPEADIMAGILGARLLWAAAAPVLKGSKAA